MYNVHKNYMCYKLYFVDRNLHNTNKSPWNMSNASSNNNLFGATSGLWNTLDGSSGIRDRGNTIFFSPLCDCDAYIYMMMQFVANNRVTLITFFFFKNIYFNSSQQWNIIFM